MIICLFIHLFVSAYAHEKQKAIKLFWTGRENIYAYMLMLMLSEGKYIFHFHVLMRYVEH